MTHAPHRLFFVALLGLAASIAMAQGTGGKTTTLGNAKAGAKLLSFDQLSQCLKQRDDLGQRKTKLEAERGTLDAQRAELMQIDETLKAERAKVDKLNETAAGLSQRGKDLSQQVSEFNERLARFEAAPAGGPLGDRQRRTLERDKAALDKAGTELAAERDAFGPNAEQMIKTYQARSAQHNTAAGEWNSRNAALSKTVSSYEDELVNWQADCEGRPYREDDEKLIRSGK